MVRKLVWLLALAFMLTPTVVADEEAEDPPAGDGENQSTQEPCSVYRPNPSGHITNKIVIDPDGCLRAWIQELIGTTGGTNSDEESGG